MEFESTENLQHSCAAQLETQPGLSSDVFPSGSHAVPPSVPPSVPHDAPLDVSIGVSGFLAWLLLWLRLQIQISVKWSHGRAWDAPTHPYEPNRFWRRRGQRASVPVRNNRPFYIFTRPDKRSGLSPTQFMERLVALSGRGRITVYGMRYWRKTVKGKAAPLGTEHEYWRDPIDSMGKLLCGVWYAHLWPEWWFLFSIKIYQRPMRPSGGHRRMSE